MKQEFSLPSTLILTLQQEVDYYRQLVNRPVNLLIQALLFPALIHGLLLLAREHESRSNLLPDDAVEAEYQYVKRQATENYQTVKNYLDDLCKAVSRPKQSIMSVKECYQYLAQHKIRGEERNRVFNFINAWQNFLSSRPYQAPPKVIKIINDMKQITPKTVTYFMVLEFLQQFIDSYTIDPVIALPAAPFVPVLFSVGSLPYHCGIICLGVLEQLYIADSVLLRSPAPITNVPSSLMSQRQDLRQSAHTCQTGVSYLIFIVLACLMYYLWTNPGSRIAQPLTLACLLMISTVIKNGYQDFYRCRQSRRMGSRLSDLSVQLKSITRQILAIQQDNWQLHQGSLLSNTYFSIALNHEQKRHAPEFLAERLKLSFLQKNVPAYSDNHYVFVSAEAKISDAMVKKIVKNCSPRILKELEEQPGARSPRMLRELEEQPGAPGL